MKKFKTLKYEVKIQIILSAIAVVACLFTLSMDSGESITFAFLISLFFIGVFNIIGFIIRLFLFKHKLNWIYLVSVVAYFAIFYALTNLIYFREEIWINIGGSVAVLLNVFYLWYGDHIVRNWKTEIDLRTL